MNDGAEVRADAVHDERLARNVHGVRDAGVSGDDFLDPVHHLDGAGLRRGIRELHIDDEIALVLIRNESARDHRVAEIGQAEQAGVNAAERRR